MSPLLHQHNLSGFKLKKSLVAMSGVLLTTFAGLDVLAQEAGEQATGNTIQLEEIVVTGTLIRGVEAVGSQTIGLDRDEIVDIGAVTTNELLGSLPQVSNYFNQRPEQDPRGAARNTLNRPNLRSLPGINDTSGATTLVLVDGHRMTPLGVGQSSFDPDFIPTVVIERVEVITDGGSSLYGADAVGGVINFITRKEFDGVQLDLGYDFGDDYSNWTTSLLAGTSWERGSGYIALAKQGRGHVRNDDIDWAARGNWNADGTLLSPTGSECLTPVGSLESWHYLNIPGILVGWTNSPNAGAGVITPVGTPCDSEGRGSYLPKMDRDWVYGGLTQQLTDDVTLDVKAYYAERTLTLASYPLGDTIPGVDPNIAGLTPDDLGGSTVYQLPSVGFSYGAHPAYRHRNEELVIQTWGVTPELTIDLNSGWQVRNTLHFGRSNNHNTSPGSDRTLASQAIASGALDPNDVAAADAGLIDRILDRDGVKQSIQEMFFVRTIADGAIMDLPAGKLRAAIGAEFAEDRARQRQGEVARGGIGSLNYKEDSRNVKSVYGELSIPVFSNLDLSLSVRHDDYSDFGETTNPSVGFTFTPADWISIYGHWGESFNAPTVLDRLATGRVLTYAPGAAAIVPDMGQRDPSRTDALLAEGAGGTLLPQTAEIWAAGFKIEPIESLQFTANYYEIDFFDLLGTVDPQQEQAVRLNPGNFIFNPTRQQLDDFLAQLENGADYANLNAADIGVIVDRRISNTDQAELKGVDFGVSYVHDTSFGTMNYSLSGNYQLDFILIQNGVAVDQLEDNNSTLSLSGVVGWQRDNMRARLNLRYSDGFSVTSEAVNQRSVGSFLVTDLALGYDFAGGSVLTDGLSLRLNIDNVFDEEPPTWRRNQHPNHAFWTLGRVFKLGLTKTF